MKKSLRLSLFPVALLFAFIALAALSFGIQRQRADWPERSPSIGQTALETPAVMDEIPAENMPDTSGLTAVRCRSKPTTTPS